MEELRNQVSRARRRLVFQQFMGTLVWCTFASFLVAAVGVSVTKFWEIGVDGNVWMWSWVGGAAAVGLISAGVWTFVVRRGALDAAIELDRRFGLKERVSSTLSLTDEEANTEAGMALINDAVRRVSRVDVKEKFQVRTGWRLLLPFVPAVAVFAIALLLPDASAKKAEASDAKKAEIESITNASELLKKKLLEKKKNLTPKGLKASEAMFKEIEKELGKIDTNKADMDKKKALVQLKDLAKKLGDRRDKLGSTNDLKKQLQNLKKVESGPADKLAQAMKQGDFKMAMEAIEDLKKQIQEGKLDAKKKEQLIKQMQQMQKQLQQMANQQQQMKQQLEKQIQQAKQQGDMDAVNQLQQKLDKMQQQDKMMDQMQQMADQLGKAAQQMKNGDMKNAAQQMQQMAQDFQMLAEELDQLETLDELMDELADARDAMNCKNCKGAGCQQCQGMGMGMGQQGNGDGLGQGQGRGERPEEETDTNNYRSKVGAKPQPGEAINQGTAGGPNKSGVSRESVRDAILKNINTKSDPLTDQRLPRDQKEHAIEYFNRFTK